MVRFLSTFFATFLAFFGALSTWHFAESNLGQDASGETSEVTVEPVKVDLENSEQITEPVSEQSSVMWELDERTNPVTGEQVATVTKRSDDGQGAITFRCYGQNDKTFDILVAFPAPIEWTSGSFGSEIASMWFKVDDGKVFRILSYKNSPSVALPTVYVGTKGDAEREFKRIAAATMFRASMEDGTIFKQTISIDVTGIQEAIAPVLALCGQTEL